MLDPKEIRKQVRLRARRKRSHARNCKGKQAYGNQSDAQAALRRHRHDPDYRMSVYRCLHCLKWHLGNVTPSVHRVLDRLAGAG